MHASGCGARWSGADVSGLGTRRESGDIHLLYWCSRCSFVTAGLMMKFRTPMISRSTGRSGRQAVRIWALQTNRPSGSRSSGNRDQSPTLSFGCMVGCPCQVWTTRADGHPQYTSDVIDERTQEHRILGTSDQTGLLGEFADHCILDAIPGLHSPARQFEGAEAAPVQQDALLAQQDRSDADADADSRVCGWDLGAPGPTGYARRSVGRAPGAGEQLDDGGASAGCDSRSIFSTRKRHSVSRSSHSCSLSSQRIEILGLLNSAARPSPPVISLARGAVRMMKWHGDEP